MGKVSYNILPGYGDSAYPLTQEEKRRMNMDKGKKDRVEEIEDMNLDRLKEYKVYLSNEDKNADTIKSMERVCAAIEKIEGEQIDREHGYDAGPDPYGQTAYVKEKEEGTKHDEGKLRYDLIPPYSLRKLAEVYTIGAEKYGDRNWEKGISKDQLVAALMRHTELYRGGEMCDKEDGQHHMASVSFYAFALMFFDGSDDFTKTMRDAFNAVTEERHGYRK